MVPEFDASPLKVASLVIVMLPCCKLINCLVTVKALYA